MVTKAQLTFNAPAAVTNTYTLSDKDGYIGFNYATIYHAPSGKVYTKTYDGDLAIHGNNYRIPLSSISNEGALSGYFYEVNEKETWYYDSKKIVVLRSDTVQHIIRLPKEFELYTEINGALVYINNMSAYKETYTFSGKEFVQREYTDVINTKFDGAIYISGNSYYTATNNNDSLIIYELLPTSPF